MELKILSWFQVNAKKKAEKKFNATLRSVGLDEDTIRNYVEQQGRQDSGQFRQEL